MRITKKQLRRIIREEHTRILKEITPGAAGQAAMGGLTPADQGFEAAQRESQGAPDFGYLAKRVNNAAIELDEILQYAEDSLIENDNESLARDMEDLMNSAYSLASAFDSLSENQ